jgi:hypothetical protein
MSDDELADVRRAHEETLRQLEALRYAETIALDELAYVEEKLKAIQDARPLNRHKRIPQFIVGCAFSIGVAVLYASIVQDVRGLDASVEHLRAHWVQWNSPTGLMCYAITIAAVVWAVWEVFRHDD